MKSPITRYGGKYYMAKDLNRCIPEHKTYAEVFGGAAHLLFKKEMSDIEVYNDIDRGLVNFFEVLRDQEKAEKLRILLELSPHSRDEFESCKNWNDSPDIVEKARRWYVRSTQSFSGNCRTWSYSKNHSRRGMSQATSKYLGGIEDKLPMAVERLRTVQVENLDFREMIKKYDSPDTFFYLDPPYLQNVREKGSRKVYDFEMTVEDHLDLIHLIVEAKAKICLSGYENEIYKTLIDFGWRKVHLGDYAQRSKNNTLGEIQKGTEYIWLNYEIK